MDDQRPTLSTPIDPGGLRLICNDNDDGRRNWFITLAYADLARLTAAYTHGFDLAMTPQPDVTDQSEPPPQAARSTAEGTAPAASGPDYLSAFRDAEALVADVHSRSRTSTAFGSMALEPGAHNGGPDDHRILTPEQLRLLAGLDPGEDAEAAASDHSKGDEADRPPHVLNANFCTFATWTSLTLGRDIRNALLPHRFDRLSSLRLRRNATNLVLEARKTHNMELSRLLGLGQRVVLWEVGTGLYAMFVLEDALNELPAVQELRFADFDGRRDFTDAATTQIADLLHHEALHALTTDVRPRGAMGLTQLRTRDLALGLASYHLARRAALEGGTDNTHRRWVAQLMLRGNLLIGAYEQRKVDQVLTYPVEDFAADFFLEHSELEAMERSGIGRWRRRLIRRVRESVTVPEWWGRFFTDQFMVLWAGDELLRLGRDLPIPPGATTFFPADLREMQDHWLQMLLYRYDHSYGNGHGTQSRIWSVFDDRMNYIVNFMRSRAQTPGLWQDPFTPEECAELRRFEVPRSRCGPVC